MGAFHARIVQLLNEGFHCSQIMLILLQEKCGTSNPELIRAMGGLGGGLFCRKTCGTLTGGCCLIGSFGARGEESDAPRFGYRKTVISLVEWFEQEFGSTQCCDLVEFEKPQIIKTCPRYIEETFLKCLALLEEKGIDITA